ncbi:hypothetical protein CGRA01v4_11223 [Colletotrichum graminicola]|nr:hypothetical protein CGRA01v4_11223 [Colletotrichum graminicola]
MPNEVAAQTIAGDCRLLTGKFGTNGTLARARARARSSIKMRPRLVLARERLAQIVRRRWNQIPGEQIAKGKRQLKDLGELALKAHLYAAILLPF